jgi:C1A family cysteine protease
LAGCAASLIRKMRELDQYGLGRHAAPDERDKLHPLRALLPSRVALPESKHWVTGPVLDQGATGSCVGHAWAGWLTASPMRTKNGPSPYQIYRECVVLDEWAANDMEANLSDTELQWGTSVRAGAKALEARGHIQEYLWAFDLDTIKRYVLLRGTVVMGTDWYTGFFEPNSKGFVKPTGIIEGGHAYVCNGYSKIQKAFRCLNSWGPAWGQKGRFWIAEDVMAQLLKDGGEAASAIEK